MNPQQLRVGVPIIYAIVVVAAFLVLPGGAATVVTVIGAMLVGLYYVMASRAGGAVPGRDRQRNRNRG